MADMQSATAEIRQGKKKKKKIINDRRRNHRAKILYYSCDKLY